MKEPRIITECMSEYPKTLTSKLAYRYRQHKAKWKRLGYANWGAGAFHAGEMRVFLQSIITIMALSQQRKRVHESSFAYAQRLSKLNRRTREPQIVVDSRTWTGRY